jgi:small subunit ribosomal protein S13
MIFLNRNLKDKKKVYVALRKIFGIGKTYSKILCNRVGISSNALVSDLNISVIKQLTKYINSECFIARELKASVFTDIQTKIKIQSYKGLRHKQGLPVNGQNTKNNSKTAKYLLRQVQYV